MLWTGADPTMGTEGSGGRWPQSSRELADVPSQARRPAFQTFTQVTAAGRSSNKPESQGPGQETQPGGNASPQSRQQPTPPTARGVQASAGGHLCQGLRRLYSPPLAGPHGRAFRQPVKMQGPGPTPDLPTRRLRAVPGNQHPSNSPADP